MVDFHKRILFSDEAHFLLNGFVNKQNCRIWSEANPQVYVETPLHPEKLTVCPELNNHDVQELWFQQDGATRHTARATIDLLKDTFGDHLISRFGPVNRPPRSCGLTPLDYFLWCYVKSLVYADKPQTLDHLEDTIRHVIADIRPQILEKVIENWTSGLDYIRASRGSPMPEIIFKIGSTFFLQPRFGTAGLLAVPKIEEVEKSTFSTDADVQEAVCKWIRSEPESFIMDEMKKWIKRLNKCVAVSGDCHEK
ncbi:uncharacterized protein TNCV_4306871 [Trichonephila clavipes]|nr:uncharacterized protein TNCV_4306871 [Trichonephila clavipes]